MSETELKRGVILNFQDEEGDNHLEVSYVWGARQFIVNHNYTIIGKIHFLDAKVIAEDIIREHNLKAI